MVKIWGQWLLIACVILIKESEGQALGNSHILKRGPIWPRATVPYELEPSFTQSERNKFMSAFSEISSKTCIRFKRRTNERGFIKIYRKFRGDREGELTPICGAELGYAGPIEHTLVLEPGCIDRGTIVHEVVHLLGFPHEHSRSDRDKFVRVNWKNLAPGWELSFNKHPGRYVTSGPYDYYSLMHYDLYTNARNPRVQTLTPLKPVNVNRVGTGETLSPTDISKLNKFYFCHKRRNGLLLDGEFADTNHDDDEEADQDDEEEESEPEEDHLTLLIDKTENKNGDVKMLAPGRPQTSNIKGSGSNEIAEETDGDEDNGSFEPKKPMNVHNLMR